jgi:DNA replication protein DnaC
MSSDLDPLLKTLNLANTRKSWQQLVARAEKEDWPYDQFLQVLLSEELAHRRATRLAKASRAADFPFLRTIEEFDFAFQSTLRLTSIGSLLSPDFVVEGRSVILFGKPGRGKTHLAIAIAYRAIQCGFEALFTTAAEMIEDLSTASRDGRLREALVRYVRPHVLVVDEVGYLAYGPDAANVLYHVVNDRHVRKRAMIFTTNKDPKRQWGAVLHDDDLAEAIVDRVLERGRLLRLDGPSVRTKHLPPDELGADDKVTSSSSRVSGTTAAELPEPTRRPPRQRHTHTSARRGTLLGAQRSGGVVLVLIGLGLGSIRSGGGLPGCAPTRTRSVCLCVSTREGRWQSHSDIETNGCEHRP